MKSSMTDQELIDASAPIHMRAAGHGMKPEQFSITVLEEMRRIADAAVRKEFEVTLRDEFARAAITGTLPGAAVGDQRIKEYAEWAYKMADAMLEVRNAKLIAVEGGE